MSAHVLALLVGSNPLPNYVTARYLLDRSRTDTGIAPVPDVILLLSSKETVPIGETIIRKLGLPVGQYVHRTLMEGQRDPHTISDSLRKAVDSISAKTSIASLHLNITGGTKPMAVFATLAGLSLPKDCPFLVSDLDPQRHIIRVTSWCQEEVQESYLPPRGTLLSVPALGLQVKDILQLHESRFKIVDNGSSAPIKFHSQPYSEKFYAESLGKDSQTWFEHLNSIKVHRGRSKNSLLESFEKVMDYRPFIEVFPSMAPYFTSDGRLSQDVDIVGLLRLFQGGWLEDMVLRAFRDLAGSGQIALSDYRKGVEVEYDRRPAEIDLIAMRGYQMYLVSCTRSSQIKDVKRKAFEALYRAEQLGGEHAQVVVVSVMSNVSDRTIPFSRENNLSELKKDLAQYDARRNCHLIGIEELRGEVEGRGTLRSKLAEIIGGVAV
ncbi:MAG TPA: hypothetical protein PLR71_00300 [Deltaproteobacteria bacterium]|nr:hypothetical protein [Deltaproteobacteria bacterium]HQI79970.1 hypothetical protein [Deltaproteobacteria bacterium]